ncbi:hypothetical protein TEA_013362 [Camellia sinensis var. sinensis]|uniref:Protein kinase domain-containing protein n=1 Tax=Camellia sinensis var. sinensis TaxID=542762 RepID=A0A4S4DIF3_CAMSN|nr:hypothetical protein TEA_013362 [Camellia sinensis var. sinensis]
MSFVPTFGFTNDTDMQALLKILLGSLAHGTVLSIFANGKELLAVIGIIREQVCTKPFITKISRFLVSSHRKPYLPSGDHPQEQQLPWGDPPREGQTPVELGKFSNLEELQLSENKLTSMIPPAILNISSINILALVSNQLHGSLPSNLGLTLPKLERIYMGENQFSRTIPASLVNASRLGVIGLGSNALTGGIPQNLGELKQLELLNFGANTLGTTKSNDLQFLTSLTNCSNLSVMRLHANQLRGVLPTLIANLSTKLIRLRKKEYRKIYSNQSFASQNFKNFQANLMDPSPCMMQCVAAFLSLDQIFQHGTFAYLDSYQIDNYNDPFMSPTASGFRGWVPLLMGLISFPGYGLIKCYIGHKEWINEMNLLHVVKHPNLVKLVGYCAEDDERGIQQLLVYELMRNKLVYELMRNKSFEDHLLARVASPLPWMERLKIAQDAARRLAYLHGEMDFGD